MSEPVVEVRGITRYFGTKAAVYDVSFAARRGEVFALLGPNGAGKTTVMRMLLGMLEPTRGSASLFGCDSRALTPEFRARVGYLAEGHHLYGWMRIGRLAEFTRGTHPRWNGKLFDRFLDYFRLQPEQRIRSLSNGQRAQVSLAVALACDPELLIMDDPTLGVDAAVRREFLRGVVDLVGREGRTVIFSSHVLADVERVADRIAILVDGVLRADLELQSFKDSLVRYHLTFESEAPASPEVPRTVSVTRSGRSLEITVVRPDDAVRAALEALGPSSCETVEMSLEDAFVDYVHPSRSVRGMPFLAGPGGEGE
jgi:ABC-2 type transport system ATP-binding protein